MANKRKLSVSSIGKASLQKLFPPRAVTNDRKPSCPPKTKSTCCRFPDRGVCSSFPRTGCGHDCRAYGVETARVSSGCQSGQQSGGIFRRFFTGSSERFPRNGEFRSGGRVGRSARRLRFELPAGFRIGEESRKPEVRDRI